MAEKKPYRPAHSYQAKDDSTLPQKLALRRKALTLLDVPVIMETHGGTGMIYRELYRDLHCQGIVMEKNPDKVDVLARQRSEWAIYQGDCVEAVARGAGRHLPINLLDVDPYGSALPVIQAFFESDRPKVEKLVIVAQDGGRANTRYMTAWHTKIFAEIVEKFGNGFGTENYLTALEWFVSGKAAKAGYNLDRFTGQLMGHHNNCAHFVAIFHS